jgi:VWFA-related protein
MLRKSLITVCLLSLLWVPDAQSQQTPANGPARTIEVTTTLVEVDAIVTDSKGKPVTNLSVDDFQILQDGKPQRITTFSRVSTTAAPARPNSNSSVAVAAAKPLAREDVKRTIAFVVDDLRFDWQTGYRTFAYIRRKLPDVFSRNLRDGDLAGLFYLSRRQGFEQYTTDREILKTLAEGLKFLPGGMQRSESRDEDDPDSPVDFARQDDAERMEEVALRGVGSIIQEMKGMPGRKSIIFLSASVGPQNLSTLIDQANSAGVTFYPVDPREEEVGAVGVVPRGPQSIEKPLETDPRRDPARININQLKINNLSPSLTLLAKETGGEGWGREEELDKRLVGALQDQESYYLIGYTLDEKSFDRKKHRIEVRLVNKDLRVRTSRSQFTGQPDLGLSQPKTSGDAMSDLLSSPYKNSGLRSSLSTFFTAEAGKTILNSAVFVDGRDLRAQQIANGKFRGGIELRAVSIDPKGNLSGQVGRIAGFELEEAAWQRARQTGMVLRLPTTGEKPGPYQIRLALRDIVSGATGTASTFLEVPDVKNGKLALSDLFLSAPANLPNPHPLSNIAARGFVRGQNVEWMVELYNAKAPTIQTSVRIFRGADLVQETPFAPSAAKKMDGRKDFAASGAFSTSDLPAGDYVIQLFVREQNSKTQVSRFTDFRILP